MRRLLFAGVAAAVSGALLVTALLLDWWDYPAAFADPSSLPPDAEFLAESIDRSGQPADADAFQFFDVRDVLWLSTGIVSFAFGLLVLVERRARRVLVAPVAGLAFAAAAFLAITVIAPPDYADVATPDGGDGFDFGVDLPLAREPGIFVALVASLGCVAAVVLALLSRPTASEAPRTSR